MANAAHVIVQHPCSPTSSGSAIRCVIGRHMEIRLRLLQDYCASPLRPIEHDLVVVAGAVAYADRIVRRRRGSGWLRELELTIPVHDPTPWNDVKVHRLLLDCLQFLTGDAWAVNFVRGGKTPEVQQSSLDFTNGPYVIIPFSDGLDSFLQWRLTALREPSVLPLRVQTLSRAANDHRNRLIERARGKKDQKLQLPVRASVGNHPEPSFRSRTFLFYSMAALAAAKVEANRVLIGENGIGALGPSLVPYGNECHHRTTHPGFTRRLATFVNAVLGTSIAFEHPQLRWTKGEVLKKAISQGVSGWENTHSCVRGPRDRLSGQPCGVCSGCLLRRVSLHSALQSPSIFFWNDLSAPNLDDSRSNATGRLATDNDWDIARHAVHSMSALADLSTMPCDAPPFRRLAWELAESLPGGTTLEQADIHRLISKHASEWSEFRRSYGESSLLNRRQRELK